MARQAQKYEPVSSIADPFKGLPPQIDLVLR